MPKKEIKIIGIAGSLRKGSYNKRSLVAAQKLLPEGSSLEIIDISEIPFFNEDIENLRLPKEVIDFKNKLASADAILIATPEYNYSIPGVLKNALDWASRGEKPPLSGKPLAIISASLGSLGGPRVQSHLRQVCMGLNMITINKPEVFIVNAHEKFDSDGNLTDENTKKFIQKLIVELVNFVKLTNKNIE